MPTYSYKCRKCEGLHDVFHKMSEKPRVRCVKPDCDGTCKKMISAGVGVVFKGPGFYETDYRKKDRKNKSVIEAIKENAPDDQLAEGGIDRKDL